MDPNLDGMCAVFNLVKQTVSLNVVDYYVKLRIKLDILLKYYIDYTGYNYEF